MDGKATTEERQQAAAVDVGERWGNSHTWGVIVKRPGAGHWTLLCVGCSQDGAEEVAGRLGSGRDGGSGGRGNA